MQEQPGEVRKRGFPNSPRLSELLSLAVESPNAKVFIFLKKSQDFGLNKRCEVRFGDDMKKQWNASTKMAAFIQGTEQGMVSHLPLWLCSYLPALHVPGSDEYSYSSFREVSVQFFSPQQCSTGQQTAFQIASVKTL